MLNDKTRANLSIPTPLYNLLNADSQKYGIAKSTIVSKLLLDYYRANSKLRDSIIADISANM